MADELVTAISDLEELKVADLVEIQLQQGEDAFAVLASCQEGMKLVGERFELGEYFVSDLVLSGEIMKKATELLAPHIKGENAGASRKVVFGTVKGDIHNIGKDIVVSLLRASGYDVLDLGVNVEPQTFVDAVKQTGAKVVGLSSLLTVAFDSMKETIAALDSAGLRPATKVMIGGGLISAEVQKYTEADAWGTNAHSAVTCYDSWFKEVIHE